MKTHIRNYWIYWLSALVFLALIITGIAVIVIGNQKRSESVLTKYEAEGKVVSSMSDGVSLDGTVQSINETEILMRSDKGDFWKLAIDTNCVWRKQDLLTLEYIPVAKKEIVAGDKVWVILKRSEQGVGVAKVVNKKIDSQYSGNFRRLSGKEFIVKDTNEQENKFFVESSLNVVANGELIGHDLSLVPEEMMVNVYSVEQDFSDVMRADVIRFIKGGKLE